MELGEPVGEISRGADILLETDNMLVVNTPSEVSIDEKTFIAEFSV